MPSKTHVPHSKEFAEAIKSHDINKISCYFERTTVARELLLTTNNRWPWIFEACSCQLPLAPMKLLVEESKKQGVLYEILTAKSSRRDSNKTWLFFAADHDLGYESLKFLLETYEQHLQDDKNIFDMADFLTAREETTTFLTEAVVRLNAQSLALLMDYCVRYIVPPKFDLRQFVESPYPANKSFAGNLLGHVAYFKLTPDNRLMMFFNFCILKARVDVDKMMSEFDSEDKNCLAIAISQSLALSSIRLFVAHFSSPEHYYFALMRKPFAENDEEQNKPAGKKNRCALDYHRDTVLTEQPKLKSMLSQTNKFWKESILMYRDRFGGLYPPSRRETSSEVLVEPPKLGGDEKNEMCCAVQ